MRVLALLPILALAACGTTKLEPKVEVVEVSKPVAVSCVPKGLKPAPTYPDTDKAIRETAGPGDMINLLAAGRLLRIQRAAETEPVVEGCRHPPDPG